MNTKRRCCLISAVLFLLITVFCFVAFKRPSGLNYNNDKPVKQLVTETYSYDELENIRDIIEKSRTDIFSLKKHCKPECIRKTEYGNYAVLLGRSDEKLFIFFDDDRTVTDCFLVKEFKFKESYDYFKIGTSTLNDVISFDENTKNISVSSFDATVSIVKQGFVFIVYERMNTDDMTFLSSPVIKSITFYDDDSYSEIIKNENCYFELPYILPIDR